VGSEETWSEVFRELKQRGVDGVRWLVSDGYAGIRAAVRTQFTGVVWQCRWIHFMRNALAKVGHKHQDVLAKSLSPRGSSTT
jgi:putative transposase